MILVKRPSPRTTAAKAPGAWMLNTTIGRRVLARQADRGGVHHAKVVGEHIEIGELLVAPGVGDLARIGGIDAIHLGALEQRVAVHLGGAQRGGGVGGEERVAGAGGEDHHPALLHVPLGAAADIGLADRGHRDRRLHPGGHAALLQRRLHGERVHHGGQHAHVVGLGAFHAGGGAGDAAEDVAAADHDADLHAHADHVADIGGDGADGVVVEAVLAPAHQGLA